MNTETHTLAGLTFILRETELAESNRPCTVEVCSLLEVFTTRGEALLWILTLARACRGVSDLSRTV